MNCVFDKEKLSAFYDGELVAAEKAEVERHIASCSECLRDLGELKSAALLIKELPRLRAPKSIAEGVSREMQAAGKVHVLARFRRGVLWASAAAAGLFIITNVLYLTSAQRSVDPAGANSPMTSTVARSEPQSSDRRANESAGEEKDAERALRQEGGRPPAETFKDSLSQGKRAQDSTRKMESPKFEEAEKVPEIQGRELLTKSAAPAPAPATAPMPDPAKPSAPPPAPVAKEAAKPAEAPLADKAARKEVEPAPRPDGELKAKVAAAAVGPSSELPPAQYNLVTTQLAKARPRIEESLKKMGVVVPPPAPSQAKAPRNREAENTIVLDLTDAQLLRLREELEKPGDARLVAAMPVDPVLGGFRTGGIYAKKDAAASGGKAPAPAPKDNDGKELAEEKSAPAEPRRRVTLHLVETKTLPAAEAEPAKKN